MRKNREHIYKTSRTSYKCPVGENDEYIEVIFTSRGINIDGNWIGWGNMAHIRYLLGLGDLKEIKVIYPVL